MDADLVIRAQHGQTLVIKRSFDPANTAAGRAELQAIVDSIKITPGARADPTGIHEARRQPPSGTGPRHLHRVSCW